MCIPLCLKCGEDMSPNPPRIYVLVQYGTNMFSKPVRETSASLTDVEFMAFATGYAVNDVRGSACEIMLDNKFGFGSKNDECFCCTERKSITNVFVIVWYTVPLNKIHHYQLALFLAVEPAVTHVLFFVKPLLFLDYNPS